jgi:hypothetical protein
VHLDSGIIERRATERDRYEFAELNNESEIKQGEEIIVSLLDGEVGRLQALDTSRCFKNVCVECNNRCRRDFVRKGCKILSHSEFWNRHSVLPQDRAIECAYPTYQPYLFSTTMQTTLFHWIGILAFFVMTSASSPYETPNS